MIDALDPIEAVRAHPGWFFGSGRFEPDTACDLLRREAESSPAVTEVNVEAYESGWFAVFADGDWLDGDLGPFTALTFFPEGGINSTRVEIVLTAFCTDVLTATGGMIEMCSAGLLAEPEALPAEISDLLLADPALGRVVVFRQ